MGHRWLYAVEADALLVVPKFIERLNKRSPAALRDLAATDLTALYRKRYTRLTKRQVPGLFWSDIPPHVRIPFVRGGPHPAGPSLRIVRRGKIVKPNPKFELVVVNKYDRAALLHLLAELDPATNVEVWLAERTNRAGATSPSMLHADYEAWCERRGDAATGSKSFVQALVAAGVV